MNLVEVSGSVLANWKKDDAGFLKAVAGQLGMTVEETKEGKPLNY